MIEIKYLKDLACKQINLRKDIVNLVGGDIYVDSVGNRYVFFGFNNLNKRPFFSLYLEIKQYDGSGTFIKTTKFRFPSIYAPKGLYVTQDPIPVEKECNGCEVFVSYADFGGKVFYNDTFKIRGNAFSAPKFGYIPQSPGINPSSEEFQPRVEEIEETPSNIEEIPSAPIVEQEIQKEEKVETVIEKSAENEPVIEEKVEQQPSIGDVIPAIDKVTLKQKGKFDLLGTLCVLLAAVITGVLLANEFSKNTGMDYPLSSMENLFDVLKYFLGIK